MRTGPMNRIGLVLLLFALVTSTLAQSPPERERGFKPELSYQFNGIDTVSLFNGNLNLTIPLAAYRVSADVSYSFVLRYSGNLWRDFEHCRHKDGECHVNWIPTPDNAGLGWRMSLGELRAASHLYGPTATHGWQYVSPDGGEHNFYKTLHEPVCATSSDLNCDRDTAGTWYTRDGTYLRLKEKTSGTRSVKILEFPDGQRQIFAWEPVTKYWQLEYIYGNSSAFDAATLKPTTNFVRIDYVAHPGTAIVDWHIRDSHDREHKVVFFAGSHAINGVVDRLELAAFGDTTATYDLVYDAQPANDEPSIIKKPYDGSGTSASVRLLKKVALPSSESWLFTYHDAPAPGIDPFSGTLIQAKLPTLGTINWSYQHYPMWSTTGQSIQPAGVKERWLEASGTKVEATRYSVSDATPGAVTVQTLVGPLWRPDSQVVNYFNLTYGESFGLPFTPDPAQSDDGTASGRKLSSTVSDCNPVTNTCGAVERRQYVKYEMDDALVGIICNGDYPCARDRNRRVLSERTSYPTDGGLYVDTNRSDFDGLGHYRVIESSGTFTSGVQRKTETSFNVNTRGYNAATGIGGSVGTYSLTAAGKRASGYSMLYDGDAWNLNTFQRSSTTEEGTTIHVDSCFDPATGFLRRQRTKVRQDGANDPKDLLTIYTRDDSSGFIGREESFGGDVLDASGQGLPDTALCSINPSRDARSFRIDYTTQFGVLKTKQFYDQAAGQALSFYSVENSSIDLNSGLVTASKDPSGLSTSYDYDDSGRLKVVDPPGLSPTVYTYTNATASAPAKVAAVTGASSHEKEWEFDPFGRLVLEKRLMPTTVRKWSGRKTAYDSAGRRESVSEEEEMAGTPFVPQYKTLYGDYDAFGRVGTITSPDGKQVTFTYTGDRVTTRTFAVAMPGNALDTLVQVTEERDRSGRLVKVTEDATEKSGTPLTTEYTYDVGNRLTTVTMATQPSRTFTYDRRGLLTSEWHPESNATSYQYDARGNVVTRTTAVATVKQEYDAAGRLKSVKQAGLPLQVYEYDSTAPAAGHSKGKPASATRYNRIPELGAVEVTEKFFYGDDAGRLTKRHTTVVQPLPAPSQTHTFFEEYTYDSLGDLTTLQYPVCAQNGCPSFTLPARSVTSTYKHGLLTAVLPYTTDTGVTYWPNGAIETVQHRNANGSDGPLYRQTIASGMARPQSIAVTNVCSVPEITIDAPASVIASAEQTASVIAVAGATYLWTISGATLVSGQGTREIRYRAACSGSVELTVKVTKDCSVTARRTVPITSPRVTVSGTRTIDQGNSATIQAQLTGAGPWIVTWSDSPTPVTVPASQTSLSRTVSPIGTTTYTATATDYYGCALTGVGEATITVIPPTPADVKASAVQSTQIAVEWSFDGSADRFDVYRDGALRGSSTTRTFADTGAALSAYVYSVKAVKAGTSSSESVRDLATTFFFSAPDPVVAKSTPVRAAHITELQNATNIVRSAAGLSLVSFPTMTTQLSITAAHLQGVRAALDEARASLNLPATSYTRSPIARGMEVKASDMNDTRRGIE